MIKILHSADWHLDSPLPGREPEEAQFLKEQLLRIPEKITELAVRENCDLMLLSGDLFDGSCTKAGLDALRTALTEVKIPVFISPGNHDFCVPDSLWLTEVWPENVHIFTSEAITSVAVPGLSCRVYGAGFQSMDCPPLLTDFHADCAERYAIGLFHGAPLKAKSPYNSISRQQVENSALDYLALGHIHQTGSFRAGSTLCAWPGCPMGRGFDETGEKGVLLVTLAETAQAEFISLGLSQFHDITMDVQGEPLLALSQLLPPAPSDDFYRVTLTGECESVRIPALAAAFSHIPHLQLRDRIQPPVELWGKAGEDTLEGIFFALLQQQGKTGELAARIAHKILTGQEVELP